MHVKVLKGFDVLNAVRHSPTFYKIIIPRTSLILLATVA